MLSRVADPSQKPGSFKLGTSIDAVGQRVVDEKADLGYLSQALTALVEQGLVEQLNRALRAEQPRQPAHRTPVLDVVIFCAARQSREVEQKGTDLGG